MSEPQSPPGRPLPTERSTPLPAHVTTPLLTQITQQSLDIDYQHVADRRAARAAADPEAAGATPRRSSVGWLAIVAAFGMLLAVAAVQTSRNAPAEELGRGALIKRINEQRTDLESQQQRASDLRAEVAEIQATRASTTRRSAEISRAAAEVEDSTGFRPISGPGAVIELTDGDRGGNSLVRDAEVALGVNALWEAGARAVAVNGIRITALSAIRNSGTVVRINRTAVQSPYLIRAIGDPGALAVGIGDSISGLTLQQTGTQYGFTVDVRTEDTLSLPAAAGEPKLSSVTTSGAAGADKRSEP